MLVLVLDDGAGGGAIGEVAPLGRRGPRGSRRLRILFECQLPRLRIALLPHLTPLCLARLLDRSDGDSDGVRLR